MNSIQCPSRPLKKNRLAAKPNGLFFQRPARRSDGAMLRYCPVKAMPMAESEGDTKVSTLLMKVMRNCR